MNQLIFLGLGKMGYRMAQKLARSKHSLIVWNRTQDVAEEFLKELATESISVSIASSIQEAIEKSSSPKIVWIMLPSGEATEQTLVEVKKYVGKGDIVIDGGNSFYKDTQRRYEAFTKEGIRYLGIGVSGGIIAETEGYPMMVGGDKSAYEEIIPFLHSLSLPRGGHEYFGEGGSGHFVKMIHNGIEYGMMQAIGEGFGVLEKAPYKFDLLSVSKLFQKGTIVSSFLIDRAHDALEKDPLLSDIVGEINATGEGEWTINQGKEEGVPVENIEQSLDFRRRSKTDEKVRDSFAAKMVAALRREFGGHAVKEKTE